MVKQTNQNFYDRFVDEEKFSLIGDYKKQRRYWASYFSFLIFCGVTATLPTFVGYNFQHPFAIVMFVEYIIFFLIAMFCFMKLLSYEKEYPIFKKKKYLVLLSLPVIFMCLAMCVVPIFTTHFIAHDNGGFEVDFNPFFYFFVFIPLFFGYVIFLYYAFLKCFAKFARTHK